MPSPNIQSITVEALLNRLGLVGYAGITAAIGAPTTSVAITVSATAWAVLADGTWLDTVASSGSPALVAASVAGLTVNGTYTLWLDRSTDQLNTPVWSVATAAPSTNALAVATVTVAGNVVSAVVMKVPGLSGLNEATPSLNGASVTAAPSAGGASALPATPLGYLSIIVNGVARQIAYY